MSFLISRRTAPTGSTTKEACALKTDPIAMFNLMKREARKIIHTSHAFFLRIPVIITGMRSRLPFVLLGFAVGLLGNATIAFALWQGPTASAPNNNVAAPINVGIVSQIKNGDVGI